MPVPVPYANLTNPQTLNLYAMVSDDPETFADLNGHCSSPKVRKGQIGICISLYTQTRTVGAVGGGDARGPSSQGGSYRSEVQLVVDLKKGKVSVVKSDAGITAALVLVRKQGTSDTTVSQPSTDKSGTLHFRVSNEALNGLAGLPGAPSDSIKTNLRLQVTPEGKVGTDPGGTRTPFPSLEVYSYDSNAKARPILQIQEHGNPYDELKEDSQKVPVVPPQ